jgi:DNA-binding beta-propeller fold protein YncE
MAKKHRRTCQIVARLLAVLMLGLDPSLSVAQQRQGAFLELESKIALGAVKGRIDHLAFDGGRQQVFIAELENNSVGVVDLNSAKLLHRISGLNKPQGVAYVASSDALFVANGGDGTVHILRGGEFTSIGQLALGSDADNVRVDTEAARVIVGYGSGALAVIDVATRTRIRDIALPAHPESFQISASLRRVFVNLPDAQSIVVFDSEGVGTVSSWSTGTDRGNFGMTLDSENGRVLVVFRDPPKLSARDMRTGRVTVERDTCADVDDVFVDAKRRRVYVTCGDGFIDVLDASADYARLGRIATRPGARTSLYIAGLDRLAVAARESAGGPAELWIYRPSP